MRKILTKGAVVASAVAALTGCAHYQEWPADQNGVIRMEYGDRHGTRTDAGTVMGYMAYERCPHGYTMLKDEQRLGKDFPLWTWEIKCMDYRGD